MRLIGSSVHYSMTDKNRIALKFEQLFTYYEIVFDDGLWEADIEKFYFYWNDVKVWLVRLSWVQSFE